ncbi:MAG: hypothetical protein H6831_05730 [Planctomycetes bacterium]|nr:hypothetical protein [Planctomycetota bacterium]MCB9903890.1 hypothetical protein [Planctomycetota bacterium]
MDEKYWSVAEVVRLSESFVCARLLSYESAAEGEFLKSIFHGPSGELENTVFCILDSDGETPLVRAGRSPDFLLPSRAGEARDLVASMERVLAKRRSRAEPSAPAALPLAVDLRRALNTAACDGLPVVALVADEVPAELAAAIWSNRLAGEAVYVRVDAAEARALEGAKRGDALLVVEPDRFGLEGRVRARTDDLGAFDAGWLRTALDCYASPAKEAREHVRSGRRAGVEWETEIPVTDSHVPPGRRTR